MSRQVYNQNFDLRRGRAAEALKKLERQQMEFVDLLPTSEIFRTVNGIKAGARRRSLHCH